MEWRLQVEPEGRTGAENMSLDIQLLERAATTGRPFLRLYRWDPPCLSLGRNEPAIDRPGIATVRRPTGGSSVWHEHEVTYAVAAPIALFGRLRAAYHAIHQRIATALRSLGIPAEIALARPLPSSTALYLSRPCFASTVGGEILVRGKKLVGSAQVRRGEAFLQHGSILLDRQILGRIVTFEEVSGAILATWLC